jgi:hypothetical protein
VHGCVFTVDVISGSVIPVALITWPIMICLPAIADFLAPSYSITSSARASSVGGTSRPNCLRGLSLVKLMRTGIVISWQEGGEWLC